MTQPEKAPLDAGVPARRRRGLGYASYLSACVLTAITGLSLIAMFGAREQFILLFIAVIVLLLLSITLLMAAEGFLVPSARDVCARDPRPPVLFLRPFEEDRELTYDVISSGETTTSITAKAEDFLLALNAVGPLISIGEPTRWSRIGLQPQGVFRDYVGHEQWQQRVEALLARSGMVVLAVGDSPGIEWEIAQARERIGPESLILYLPPRPVGAFTRKGREQKERAIYEHFKPLVERHFEVALPEFNEALYIIGFGPSGDPVVAPEAERRGWALSEHGRVEATIRAQLEAVLARVRPEISLRSYSVPGRTATRWRASVALLILFASVGLGIAADSGGNGFDPALGLLLHSLPQLILISGWVLLARYFARPWVWAVPALLGVGMLLHLWITVTTMSGWGEADPFIARAWFGGLSLIINSAYGLLVLALGLAVVGRPAARTAQDSKPE